MLREFRLVVFLFIAISALAAERQVTIVYSNDYHAAVEPMKATWLVDQPMIGGAKAFAAWIDMLRKNEPNPFLFDSGDLYKTFLDGKDLNDTGENLVDVVVEYVRKAGQVAAPAGGRLAPVSQ